MDLQDIMDLLQMGMSFRCVDFTPEPKRQSSDYDRYMEFIDNVAPSFDDFGDGWGGDSTPRDMAMKMYPYEDWLERFG